VSDAVIHLRVVPIPTPSLDGEPGPIHAVQVQVMRDGVSVPVLVLARLGEQQLADLGNLVVGEVLPRMPDVVGAPPVLDGQVRAFGWSGGQRSHEHGAVLEEVGGKPDVGLLGHESSRWGAWPVCLRMIDGRLTVVDRAGKELKGVEAVIMAPMESGYSRVVISAWVESGTTRDQWCGMGLPGIPLWGQQGAGGTERDILQDGKGHLPAGFTGALQNDVPNALMTYAIEQVIPSIGQKGFGRHGGKVDVIELIHPAVDQPGLDHQPQVQLHDRATDALAREVVRESVGLHRQEDVSDQGHVALHNASPVGSAPAGGEVPGAADTAPGAASSTTIGTRCQPPAQAVSTATDGGAA
jgi:hypothetical protein